MLPVVHITISRPFKAWSYFMFRPSMHWLAGVLAAVVIAEAGFWTFRHVGWRPADGIVYSWPEGLAQPPASSQDLETSIGLFQANRGGHPHLDVGPGRHLLAYYFEWDALPSALTSPTGGHLPEVCNRALGYQFVANLPPRQWPTPGGMMIFDTTQFRSPSGHNVFIFKNIWFRGLGNWEERRAVPPWQRLSLLSRHRLEQARLLTAGIFGHRTAESAWQAFADHILSQLQWYGMEPQEQPAKERAAAHHSRALDPWASPIQPARMPRPESDGADLVSEVLGDRPHVSRRPRSRWCRPIPDPAAPAWPGRARIPGFPI